MQAEKKTCGTNIHIPRRNSDRPDRLAFSMCNTVRQQSSLNDRPKRGRDCSVHNVFLMSRYSKHGVCQEKGSNKFNDQNQSEYVRTPRG